VLLGDAEAGRAQAAAASAYLREHHTRERLAAALAGRVRAALEGR
jgi:hypothetical protein